MDTDNAYASDRNHQRALIVLSIVAALLFLSIPVLRPLLAGTDEFANIWASSVQNPGFTSIAILIDAAFDTVPLLASSILVSAYLFVIKKKRLAVILVLFMLIDAALVGISKDYYMISRPTDGLILSSGFSYPSGHATSTFVLFGILAYFAWAAWNSRRAKAIFTLVCIVLILVVGFDRIYLRVHWLSDVIGAYILGISILSIAIWVTGNDRLPIPSFIRSYLGTGDIANDREASRI